MYVNNQIYFLISILTRKKVVTTSILTLSFIYRKYLFVIVDILFLYDDMLLSDIIESSMYMYCVTSNIWMKIYFIC